MGIHNDSPIADAASRLGAYTHTINYDDRYVHAWRARRKLFLGSIWFSRSATARIAPAGKFYPQRRTGAYSSTYAWRLNGRDVSARRNSRSSRPMPQGGVTRRAGTGFGRLFSLRRLREPGGCERRRGDRCGWRRRLTRIRSGRPMNRVFRCCLPGCVISNINAADFVSVRSGFFCGRFPSRSFAESAVGNNKR